MILIDQLLKKSAILSFIILIFFSLGSNQSYAQDSSKSHERQQIDSALLSDTNILTQSDYLTALEKVLETQNKVPSIVGGFSHLDDIADGLADDDSAIALIKERLATAGDRTINIQNLQMFDKLLDELLSNVQDDYNSDLSQYSTQLEQLKADLLAVKKDSIVHQIYINAGLRKTYATQLLEIRNKWKVTDSLIIAADKKIKALKANASVNAFAIAELIFKNDGLEQKAALNAFEKERRYIWEPINWALVNKSKSSFERKLAIEKKIANYYFQNTSNNRIIAPIIGLIFFLWVFYNFSSLKRLNKLDALQKFNLRFISPYPIFASLIFIFSLAPLFDLDAPVIFQELLQALSLLVLSIFLAERLPRSVFFIWVGFGILFIIHPVLRLLSLPIYQERYWMVGINSVAFIYGSIILLVLWKKTSKFKLMFAVGIMFVVLNLLALLTNVFGRVTLSQTLNATAFDGFAQATAFTILIGLIVEAFLLQIQSSRLRKRYPEDFNYIPVTRGLNKLASFGALFLWLIILLDNLNLLILLTDSLTETLAENHTIGSFSFSLGGILLFLAIITIANFLQKYISYFFGDLGEDMQVENNEGRSRLLMTRLIVLIAGFLLAVAASGLPIDRITIILGALSVGIGLGLQNIVNNFVSGIILIFDRTLHIGDVVEVSDKKGRVREIGIRTSKLLTDDGAEIIIPNGDVVSHNIINWTLTNPQVRMNISFTISKPYQLEEVIAICKKELVENVNVVAEKEPDILITAVTPTSATIKIYFWCKSITLTESTYSTLYPDLYSSLESQGVKII